MDLEKFNRHMGKPVKFKILDDEFEMLPLGVQYIGEIIELSRHIFNNDKDGKSLATKEDRTRIGELCKIALKETYPELTDKQLDVFVTSNYVLLSKALFDTNTLGTDKLEAVRKLIADANKSKTK